MDFVFFIDIISISTTVLIFRYGKLPATLNKNIIQYSIDNKFGHTQKPEDTCGDNFHPDHHLYHMKNFGLQNCLMDMYFGTCAYNEKYMVKPSLYFTDTQEIIFDVEKKIEDDDTVFHFTPRSINREGRTSSVVG